jgi:NADH-quinone oxidoreductase subunit M
MSMIILLAILFGVRPNLITDIMGVAAYQVMGPVVTLTQMGVI